MKSLIACLLFLIPAQTIASEYEIANHNGNARDFIPLGSSRDSAQTILTVDNISGVSFAAVRFLAKRQNLIIDRDAGNVTLLVNECVVPVPLHVIPPEAGRVRLPIDARMLHEERNRICLVNPGGREHAAYLGRDAHGNPLIGVVLNDDEDHHLIGRWDFDLNTSDASGRGHNGGNGVKTFVHYEKGQVNYGISFRGRGLEGLKIPFGHEHTLPENFSCEAWIKPAMENEVEGYILDICQWKICLKLNERMNPIITYWTENGPHEICVEDIVVPRNEWSRIGVVFERGSGYLLFNGRVVGCPSMEYRFPKIAEYTGDIIEGGDWTRRRGFWGLIDEVRLRNDSYISAIPMDVHLDLTSEESADISAYAFGLLPDKKPHALSYALKNPEMGSIVNSGELALFKGKRAFASLPLKNLHAGTYAILFQAQDSTGKVLAEDTESFEIYDPSRWADNIAYSDEEVLPPWTPIQASAERINVWGREYDFAGHLFPHKIVTRESEILDAPIRLEGSIESQPFSLAGGSAKLLSHSDARAIVRSEGATNTLKATAQSVVEFDGMIMIDLTITPRASEKYDYLNLVIPIRKQHASHFNYWPRIKFPEQNFGALPEAFTSRFVNHVWVGDTRRGLAWFADSFRGWRINPDLTAITLCMTENAVNLVVSLINEPEYLSEPMHITFGLQATPVKPMPRAHRSWNMNSGLPGEIQQDWPGITRTSLFSIPIPVNPETYRKRIRETHDRGMLFIPYGLFSCIDTPPMQKYSQYLQKWDAESYEWDIDHMRLYARTMCTRQTDFQDFWCSLYEEFLDNYDVDGFYFDMAWPYLPCSNPHHESTHCYFYDKNGTKQYEYQIFARRELMRKIYALTKRKNPRNILINHFTASLITPILSFCDAYLDGEHLKMLFFEGDYDDFLTDDVRIAEFCGDQFGVDCIRLPEFRGADAQSPQKARIMIWDFCSSTTRACGWHGWTVRRQ